MNRDSTGLAQGATDDVEAVRVTSGQRSYIRSGHRGSDEHIPVTVVDALAGCDAFLIGGDAVGELAELDLAGYDRECRGQGDEGRGQGECGSGTHGLFSGFVETLSRDLVLDDR